MVVLTPDDPRIRIEGLAELIQSGDWWIPCRLPVSSRGLLVDEQLLRVARMAAGVQLAFTTDAVSLSMEVDVSVPPTLDGPVAPFDVIIDGMLWTRETIEGRGVLRVDGLEGASKKIVIWLPHYGVTKVGRLTLEGATAVSSQVSERPHLVTYGSSITQCRQSSGPSTAWPALVAAARGWRLTNLGFAGQCHLDPVVARYIRDTPADIVSLCLGINIWGASSFPRRTLAPAIVGFIETVRDGHPMTPLLVTTPIASQEREHQLNEAHLTLAEIRSIVSDVVVALQERGDENLFLIAGPEVLSLAEQDLLVDGLHPGPQGYELMADRLGERIVAVAGIS